MKNFGNIIIKLILPCKGGQSVYYLSHFNRLERCISYARKISWKDNRGKISLSYVCDGGRKQNLFVSLYSRSCLEICCWCCRKIRLSNHANTSIKADMTRTTSTARKLTSRAWCWQIVGVSIQIRITSIESSFLRGRRAFL